MATTRYEEALRQVQSLSPSDQKRLLDEIRQDLGEEASASVSILELKGLGKDLWQGMDAQDRVRRERDSWDG